MTSSPQEEEKIHRHRRGETHGTTEAETEVLQLQAREHQGIASKPPGTGGEAPGTGTDSLSQPQKDPTLPIP